MGARPSAQELQDGATIEVSRVCLLPDAPKYAASRAYAAICQAGKALGYKRAISYTLASEAGTSLKAAGFEQKAPVKFQSWNRRKRPRYDRDLFGEPLRVEEDRVRWERPL